MIMNVSMCMCVYIYIYIAFPKRGLEITSAPVAMNTLRPQIVASEYYSPLKGTSALWRNN